MESLSRSSETSSNACSAIVCAGPDKARLGEGPKSYSLNLVDTAGSLLDSTEHDDMDVTAHTRGVHP